MGSTKRPWAMLSNTRPEWLLGDLGSVLSGAATVTLYQSNTADECAYIISNSELSVLFAEDEEQLAKLQSIREQILCPAGRALRRRRRRRLVD